MADMRLIDANALDFALVDEYITDKSLTAALTGKGRCIFNAAIDIARCRVADAETVDAVPVVHGRWVKARGMMPPEYHHRKCCSLCGGWALSDIFGRECLSQYCPHCGQPMDAKGMDAPTKDDKED